MVTIIREFFYGVKDLILLVLFLLFLSVVGGLVLTAFYVLLKTILVG